MRFTEGNARILCEKCDATIPAHKWGQIKQGADWFFSRAEDKAYCPKHIPTWVPAWREWRGSI